MMSPRSRGPGAVRNNNRRSGPKPNTRTPKAPPKPKTAADLDKELEAYVQSGDSKAKTGEDIDMAA